jgi:dihydrofolate reductase
VISIVVAYSRNHVIGRDGRLPWHLPGDMRRFRELTTGHAVVMGRRTFESLPDRFRPLPNRRNLVLTSRRDYDLPGIETFQSLEAALAAAGGDCFVIGGEQVFREALPVADRLYLTRVEAECEGDAFFPVLDEEAWRCVDESEPVVENGFEYVFRVCDRRA